MFNEVQANEKPFVQAGQNALTGLAAGTATGAGGVGTGALNKPFDPSNFQNTPGYQFELAQINQGVNSAATASGGVGGANTLKALGGYDAGLVSTTYQQQLQDYMAQQQQTFGQEYDIAQLGANAGSNSATNASGFAGQAGAALQNAGNASAAGLVGAGSAINNLSSNYLLARLIGQGGAGGYGGGGGGGGIPGGGFVYGNNLPSGYSI